MKAIEISRPGGPEVLRCVDRLCPQPGAGEVLIRVMASGLNRPDVMQRKGLYPPPPGVTDIPGLEVAGEIVAGDPAALSAAGLIIGQSICALVAGGGYAEFVVAPARQCLPIPTGLTLIEAASLPETFFTVWSNLIDQAEIKAGESVLIHGGTSGIGVAAIQLAKTWGCQVFVTVGHAYKQAQAESLGADLAINYQTQDFQQEILHRTHGQGVNVILDMVAGPYVTRNVACLATGGRLLMIALQGGVQAEFNAAQLLLKGLTISGSTLRARSLEFKAAIRQSLRQTVWPWIAARKIRPVVDRVFPAAQVVQAHTYFDMGQHVGKVVLAWDAL